MILLFSHVRTGRWASVMPAKLAETLGLTDTLRAIPITEPEAVQTIGLVVPAREPMMPNTAALVGGARAVAATLDRESSPRLGQLTLRGGSITQCSLAHEDLVRAGRLVRELSSRCTTWSRLPAGRRLRGSRHHTWPDVPSRRHRRTTATRMSSINSIPAAARATVRPTYAHGRLGNAAGT